MCLDGVGPSYWYTQKFDYIGFPYGGDVLVFKWGKSYRLPTRGEIGFSVTALWHGKMDMYTNVSIDSGYANYGNPELNNLVSGLFGKLYVQFNWILRSTYTKASKTYGDFYQDFQCTFGTTLSLYLFTKG
jgi:hypothetical protein